MHHKILNLFVSIALLVSILEPQTPVLQSWSLVSQKLLRTPKVSNWDNTPYFLSRLLPNTNLFLGARTTPSVVAFAEDGTRHVGDVAKRQVSIFQKDQWQPRALLSKSEVTIIGFIFVENFWN